MEFPPLTNDHFDTIIKICWKGQFALFKDLSEDAKSLFYGSGLPQSLASTSESCSDIQEECQPFVDNGLLIFD